MCNPGAKERDDKRFQGAWDGTLAMFRVYRPKGAPIGFAPDPARPTSAATPLPGHPVLRRLPGRPPARGGTDDAKLRPVDPSRAWLAPVLGEEAEPASSYRGDPAEAVWLLDERVAQAWMEYVRTGAVGDATPPPSPTGVEASRRPTGALR